MHCTRKILFLQGPPTAFWPELAQGFEAAGHEVRRVNLCLADRLFWRRPGAVDYRGSLARWPDWLGGFLEREQISDILYYADRLPYHVAAAELTERLGIRAWAVEYGYLRPSWLTLEPIAMGHHSRFTRDPAKIRQLAAGAPAPDMAHSFPHGFSVEAVHEVTFGLTMVAGRPLYPRFRSDRYYHPVLDYLSWLGRLAGRPGAEKRARAQIASLRGGGEAYFVVALQLQGDYQLRCDPAFGHQAEMLERVMASFAAHSGPTTRLVVKLHPLDNGWERWPRRIRGLARIHGIEERLSVIDGGRLEDLVARAAGLVTTNSTSGIQAMRQKCPVIALGDAIYDLPGLTHQSGLDSFWVAPEPPDDDLMRAFIRALAAEIQVKGSFFNRAGRQAAINEIVRRITDADRYFRLYRGAIDPDQRGRG